MVLLRLTLSFTFSSSKDFGSYMAQPFAKGTSVAVPSTTVAPEGDSVQVTRQTASSPATETISALASTESPTITGAAKFSAMLPIRRVGPAKLAEAGGGEAADRKFEGDHVRRARLLGTDGIDIEAAQIAADAGEHRLFGDRHGLAEGEGGTGVERSVRHRSFPRAASRF